MGASTYTCGAAGGTNHFYRAVREFGRALKTDSDYGTSRIYPVQPVVSDLQRVADGHDRRWRDLIGLIGLIGLIERALAGGP